MFILKHDVLSLNLLIVLVDAKSALVVSLFDTFFYIKSFTFFWIYQIKSVIYFFGT